MNPTLCIIQFCSTYTTNRFVLNLYVAPNRLTIRDKTIDILEYMIFGSILIFFFRSIITATLRLRSALSFSQSKFSDEYG